MPLDAPTTSYIQEVFGTQDNHLAGVMTSAQGRGVPAISVSAPVGHFLQAMAAAASKPGGLALELGTLAGYSGIWIARGLAPGATLVTVEPEPLHAQIARANFLQAGVSDRIDLWTTTGLDAIARLARERGPACLDLVFIDAIKSEYPAYLDAVRPLIRPGGVLVADNCITSRFHITDPPGDPMRDGVDRFNRMIAADPGFAASIVPLGSGMVVATRLG